MTHKSIFVLYNTLLAALGFALLCAAPLSAETEKIVIKVASVAPSRSPWDIEQRRLGQRWSQVTGGLVDVRFSDATAQGGEGGIIQKLRSVRPGQKPPLDGAIFTSIGVYNLAPETNILTLCTPFLFRNQAEVDYIFDRFSGEMAAAFSQKGYHLLGWFPVGWIYFVTKERAETPEQLKRLRLALGGIGSSELTAAFKIAGFNVDNTPMDKLVQSIRSPGGIQGVYSIPFYAYSLKLHETLRYVVDLPICPVISAFFVSDDVWARVPERYKEPMLRELQKTEDTFLAVQKDSDKEYLQKMTDAGVTRVALSPELERLWEDTLRADALRMARTETSVINLPFQTRILAALDEYRSGKR